MIQVEPGAEHGKSGILAHETWAVQDASKLQAYMACPRRHFYEYVLGWRRSTPNVHLVFGTAWHLAMEAVLLGASYEEALLAFAEHYREHFPPEWDETNAPKNLAGAASGLAQYMDEYKDDAFEVLYTEISGSVALGESELVYYKLDSVLRDSRGLFALEHKTGSNFSASWTAQWRQKMQVGIYTHVLHCLAESEREVHGVVINGAFFKRPPRLRKDGQPYAGQKGTEFHRVTIRRPLVMLEAWLENTLWWYHQVERDYACLAEASPDDHVLRCFAKNTESCTRFGSCPFLDYCTAWPNPLARASAPPTEYTVEFRDPREGPGIRQLVSL